MTLTTGTGLALERDLDFLALRTRAREEELAASSAGTEAVVSLASDLAPAALTKSAAVAFRGLALEVSTRRDADLRVAALDVRATERWDLDELERTRRTLAPADF